jgi:PAS domain S-box-containing protein
MDTEPRAVGEPFDELDRLRRRVAELEAGERGRGAAQPEDQGELFRHLVENSLGLMCVHDLDGNLIFVNPAAAQTLGFRPEDGVGWSLRRFLSPSVEGEFDAYLERIRTNGVDSGLMRLVAKAGVERIWSYRNVLHQTPGGPPRVLGHALDVTDRLRAERALKESERRFRLLADTAPVLIWMADPEGRCTFVNRPWIDFTGRELPEPIGAGWIESIHPGDRAAFVEAYREAVAARAPLRAEHRLRRVDGEYCWMLGSGVPRIGAGDTLVGFIGSCVDVTVIREARETLEKARNQLAALVDQRTAELRASNAQLRAEMAHRAVVEEEVARTRRIESLEVLAGGLAHEFNNLLTVIVGRSQLLGDQFAARSSVRRELESIELTAQRAAALTQQLLSFGRKQVLQPRPVDLNQLIAGLSLAPVVGSRIDLTLRLDQALRPALLDPELTENLVLHLVQNASEAMPGGGFLVLETANIDLDEAFVQAHPGARVGPYVQLSIHDAGAGMDEATRTHIFEPFFTARVGVQGSGLGLAAAYGITKQHGGYITVESVVGRGTVFTVYLPAAEQASPGVALTPGREPGQRGGAETVLLVDDEEDVRELIRDILEAHGYRVIEVRDPEAALSRIEQGSEPVHLIVTDVQMPGMSGPALVDRLAAARPGVRALYVSGYSAEALGSAGVLGARVALVEKPFTVPALLRKVREVLDG